MVYETTVTVVWCAPHCRVFIRPDTGCQIPFQYLPKYWCRAY